MISQRGFQLLGELLDGCSAEQLDLVRSLLNEGATMPTYWVRRLLVEAMNEHQGTDTSIIIEGVLNDLFDITCGGYPVEAITPERFE